MDELEAKKAAEHLICWFEELPAKRGPRARLRRCGSIDEIQLEEEFYSVKNSLARERIHVFDNDRLAVVIGLLVWVDANNEAGEFAEQMARKAEGGGLRLSEIRFKRLLRCDHYPELYAKMRRALRLLGDVNVLSLHLFNGPRSTPHQHLKELVSCSC